MSNIEVARLDDVVITGRPLWIVRMIGLAPLLLGLFIIFRAVEGNVQVNDDFLNYARPANAIERLLIGGCGTFLTLLGLLFSYFKMMITLNGSFCEARMKYQFALISWPAATRSCRKFTKVRIERSTFVLRICSMISFRVSLEGEGEEPLWLGDFMGVELANGKTFYMSFKSAYEHAHACAESAAAALKLPVSE
jgi:hypothetical protein